MLGLQGVTVEHMGAVYVAGIVANKVKHIKLTGIDVERAFKRLKRLRFGQKILRRCRYSGEQRRQEGGDKRLDSHIYNKVENSVVKGVKKLKPNAFNAINHAKTNGFARLCRLLARTPLFLNYFRLRNLNKVKNRNNL